MTHHAAHLLPLLVAAAVVWGAAWQAVRAMPPGRAAQLVTAASVLSAAAVHVVAAQEHTDEQRAFFVLVTVGQLLLSAMVLQRPDRAAAVVVLSGAGLLALWLESRTVGVHYGVEPVGTADALAGGLELLALVAARWLRSPGSRPIRLSGEVAAWALIVVAGSLAAAT